MILAVMVLLAVVCIVSLAVLGYNLHQLAADPDNRLTKFNIRDAIIAAIISGGVLLGLVSITTYNP